MKKIVKAWAAFYIIKGRPYLDPSSVRLLKSDVPLDIQKRISLSHEVKKITITYEIPTPKDKKHD